MKIRRYLPILAALLAGAGCRSGQNQASRPPASNQVTYTIESIPVQRLSATSRQGDRPGTVYSSNIIAVYVHRPGEANTNAATGDGLTNGRR